MWAVQNGLVDPQGGDHQADLEDGRISDSKQNKSLSSAAPYRIRLIIFVGVAIVFVVIGFSLSRLILPSRGEPQTGEILTSSVDNESRWERLADMPTARAGLASAVYDNQIYAIAGEGTQGVLNVNERYDHASNSWETLSPKPVPVTDVHAGVIGGQIYIPGGRLESGEVTNVLDIYDPRTNTWSKGSPLPVALSAYALATFEGKLYLFGGNDGDDCLDVVYMYDSAQDSWTERTSMPTARAFAGAAEVGGKIFVIGGSDGDKPIDVNEAYTPNEDKSGETPWSIQRALPTTRYAIGTSPVGGFVYVFGGLGDDDRAGFDYFAGDGVWKHLDIPKVELWSNMGMVARENQMIVIGGFLNGLPTSRVQAYTAIYTVVLPIIEQ